MTFLGWLSDPFKGLSDLQLGDEKGTLNHQVFHVLFVILFIYFKTTPNNTGRFSSKTVKNDFESSQMNDL